MWKTKEVLIEEFKYVFNIVYLPIFYSVFLCIPTVPT